MDLQWRDGASASRFGIYVERLTRALGHADRVAPFQTYCVGLMLPGQRKSVEPMAARVEPARVGAAHQSLHHFVAQAAWDDGAVLAAVRDMVLPAIQAQGPIRPGSSMTPACPRRVGILLVWAGNTADKLASRTIAR